MKTKTVGAVRNSLIEKALNMELKGIGRPTTLPFGPEAEDLAWAAISGKVRPVQVIKLLGMKGNSNYYPWIYARLKSMIEAGRVTCAGAK